ncbi:nuclear transport factor 2 family protein [Hymenobacter sp. DH14]|uniref:Nuclear transport factor 2 family protein n=1 Tax=Hymenobacter cyanobacteriorum TaxID=2926463 RepID=A0A9X1VGV6_9BACT|nr:nuclear transport factor 2 family protein [Hymenobacter cyanobacteriorum]MCI1186665.1 nuclear transport factor 2 family protein [Hymenobacter cyanobacteriorum]
MKTKLTLASLATLLLSGAVYAQTPRQAVLAAESSFAEQVTKNGMKTAFLTNAAPTAMVVENGKLVEAQAAWNTRPVKPNTRLTWYPLLADVAQTGDLGYTTGPWTMLQNDRAQAAGEYVTLWRKQPDGQWKYVVNMGIERIGVPPSAPATVPAPRQALAMATPSMAPTSVLLDLDARFAAAEVLKPGATYQQYLSAEARLYRPGLSMMQGLAAVANMKNLEKGYIFAPTTGYLSAGGDLGYVLGTYRHPGDAKHPQESGSYVRIWRREAEAGWRLALEMFNSPAAVAAPAGPAPVAEGAGTAPAAAPARRAQ